MTIEKGQRAYISGAISSISDFEKVKKMFRDAEHQLEQMGYVPISPLNSGVPKSEPWSTHMKVDIGMLCTCDFLVALPTWKQSLGAKIEIKQAKVFDMPIMRLSKTSQGFEKTENGSYKQTKQELILKPLND